MTKTPVNRIPSDRLGDYQSWQAPEIDDASRVVPSAEREASARRKGRRGEVVGEDVQGEHRHEPLTAEQLSEITDQAYREGFEQGQKDGHEAGKRDGYEAGKQQALEATREELLTQAEQLAQITQTLLDPTEQQTEKLQTLVLETVLALAESVVKRELTNDTSHVRALVREALAALPGGSDNITIFVNPDDLAFLEDLHVPRVSHWQLRPDSELQRGGCRVETRQSIVDYSVESRLQDIAQRFMLGELASETQDPSEAPPEPQQQPPQSAEPTNSTSAPASNSPADSSAESESTPNKPTDEGEL